MNNLSKYELMPIYDNAKSFYGKARVEEGDTAKNLYSYSVLVAQIDELRNKANIFCTHSQTTLRHIKEFLKQNGFKAETKKQILNDYK